MKINKLSFPLIITSLLASSCGGVGDPYSLDINYKADFKILWLTDIHYGPEADSKKEAEFNHLDKIIKEAGQPDLIIITGDAFRRASLSHVSEFFSFLDSYGIKWAFTFGNHDQETFKDSPDYISEEIAKCKNKVYYDDPKDGFYGKANYYINLKSGSKTIYRLFMIDSNADSPSGEGYDVIHEDQLKHLEQVVSNNDDSAVNLAFIHIPLFQYQSAWDGFKIGLYQGRGNNGETCCIPYMDNGAYQVFKKAGIKACFAGHDHLNYSDINYKGEMILSYGLKANDLDYHDDAICGYKTITLPEETSSFGLENIQLHSLFMK